MQHDETNDAGERISQAAGRNVFESPSEQLALKLVAGQLARLSQVIHTNESSQHEEKAGNQRLRVLAATTGPGLGFWKLVSEYDASEHFADVDLFEVEHYRYAKWIERALAASIDPGSTEEPLGALVREGLRKQSYANEPRHRIELSISNPAGGRLRLVCQADPPDSERYDLAVLVLRRDGTAEWTRDLLQRFSSAIAEHGTMVVATDHHDDHWIGDQLRSISKQVRRERIDGEPQEGATAYVVQRSSMRFKIRNFDDQFAFRDSGRLIPVVSRPGVFSHRKLDLGARRLIDTMEILPGQRVLDIGCGTGVVGLAAALREATATITAIDSHARAIQCTIASARLNRVDDRLQAHLTSDGRVADPGTYDVALANAPYFANLRIAELFMESARKALRPGGRVWAVGKQPDWYQVNAPRWFDRVSLSPHEGGYWVMTGICPSSDAG